jgi:hypothetical protein
MKNELLPVDEAAKQFTNALNVYKESKKYPSAAKDEAYAFVHKFWAEALAGRRECALAKDHFYSALNHFPQVRKNVQDTDFASIQYGITWSIQCLAASDNAPPPNFPPQSDPQWPTLNPQDLQRGLPPEAVSPAPPVTGHLGSPLTRPASSVPTRSQK